MENSKNEKVRAYFAVVLKELSYVKMTSEGKLNPTCDELVEMIFKLHANKWNRGMEDAPAPATNNYASTMASRTPVYYELPDS